MVNWIHLTELQLQSVQDTLTDIIRTVAYVNKHNLITAWEKNKTKLEAISMTLINSGREHKVTCSSHMLGNVLLQPQN